MEALLKNTFWKFFGSIGIIVTVFFLIAIVISWKAMNGIMGEHVPAALKKDSVLVLDLKGVIIDGKKILKDLRKYRDENSIKGILVRIDSPGGVVGPSQEIYEELKRTSQEIKKPVVISVSSLAASGGYYSAVGGDWIVVNPGALLGSIGVIMEFANLEGLYDWAKIKRYSLTTGKFKDAGAEYRKMTDEERSLFQSMINEVLDQFVKAIADGRKLPEDKVKVIADGRIFTGQQAVKLGLADQLGTFTDSVKKIGELTGLGEKPELFFPPKERPNPFDFIMTYDTDQEEETAKGFVKALDHFTKRNLAGKPLFIMPSAL